MRLYLIRHPQPLAAEGICYGRSDLDVAAADLQTCTAALREQLDVRAVERWISSPLQRCSKLAVALSGAVGAAVEQGAGQDAGQAPPCSQDSYPVLLDERLLEMDFGSWEGMRWEDIDRRDFDCWAADYLHNAPPGGESLQAVVGRTQQLLQELHDQPWQSVAVVAHAGVIRSILTELLDIPFPSTWRINIGFGSLLVTELGAESHQNRLLSLSS
ncbi:MAG: alpha-ribazole phosphatase family protein [Actinomycetia bacterium]|nr:alpha-ribazole phosphatase family protein [Actinomycetes bacterium]